MRAVRHHLDLDNPPLETHPHRRWQGVLAGPVAGVLLGGGKGLRPQQGRRSPETADDDAGQGPVNSRLARFVLVWGVILLSGARPALSEASESPGPGRTCPRGLA